MAALSGIQPVSLTRSEFAAVRAYVQGMPATMVVARYLSDDADDDDGSSALRTLLGLRDRMVQLAHLHGRQDLAELLELGPGRSNRGMDRRVDALAALERLGTALPRAGHGVELWFGPSLARRLRKAEIVTLEALVGAANTRGGGWWRTVPRIGALAGQAINHWLGQHREVLKCDAGKPLLASHVGNRKALVVGRLSPDMGHLLPLEWMAEAAGSAGSAAVGGGSASASWCTYTAGIRAVRGWLDAAAPGRVATHLAYRKEAERLLLWAAVERRKGLEDLDRDDCSAYLAFLANPAPASRWCGPRAPRQSAGWRPFTGPLSPSSIRHAVRVLAALSAWLTRHGYRCGMSWDLSAVSVEGDGEVVQRKARHDNDAIAPFLAWLQDEGLGFEAARLRAAEAAIRLMRERGLGVERLAMVTLASLAPSGPFRTEADGVAGEPGHHALSAPTRMALARHWQDRGLDWENPPADDIALVGPPRPAPTTRAQRKLAVTPHPGYSVRGLHALLSAALRRYRDERDDGFSARTPRDLQR